MITVVFWLWKDPLCHRQYTVEHVERAVAMVDRNLTLPHRFVLITDQPVSIANVRTVPLWPDFHLVKAPSERWRRDYVQCYVRLRIFSAEDYIRDIVGERFVSMDLDMIVSGSLDPLFSRTEDFLIVKALDHPHRGPYNGSMWMMTTGARREVWEDFSLEAIKAMPDNIDFHITDQGWILYRLGEKEAGWDHRDGVYLWPSIVWHQIQRPKQLPKNARVSFFNGGDKPWDMVWSKKLWMAA